MTLCLPQNQDRANGGEKFIYDAIKIYTDTVREFPFKFTFSF